MGNPNLPGTAAQSLTKVSEGATSDDRELATQRSLAAHALAKETGRPVSDVFKGIELEAGESGKPLGDYFNEVAGAGLTRG